MDQRIAVVMQEGLVVSVERDAEPTTRALLDISERVSTDGREEGLLGLAFDPSYEESGELYLYYSAASQRRSVLSRFTAASDGRINPDSEEVLMEIPQPYSNHNGGMIEFGPDGYLYIGVGDGGSGGDPHGNGQNTQTLLGNILRIDPSVSGESKPYAIPAGNPFADGESGRAEVWAYGLRNPWRFSFGPEGRLWAGDVGQNAWEEIDIVESGGNYGWNIMEGNHCFRPSEDCEREGLMPPIVEYSHNLGCSVTGGYVYRGSDIEWLRGAYVFGDFCSGRVWAMTHSDGQAEEVVLLADTGRNIASFGEDSEGELFVLAGSGVLYLREASAGDEAG
ncbi:MAG: PQQ-dependent sugar dehydrogenase [Chloroflexota bacterium]